MHAVLRGFQVSEVTDSARLGCAIQNITFCQGVDQAYIQQFGTRVESLDQSESHIVSLHLNIFKCDAF